MSYIFHNKLAFIDSFYCLSFLSDSLVKKLDKNDFKNLMKEFDREVLNLFRQNEF